MARLTLISLVLLGDAVSGFAPRSTIRATRRTTLASAEVDEEETISAEELEIRREAAMIAKKKRWVGVATHEQAPEPRRTKARTHTQHTHTHAYTHALVQE